MQKMNGFVRLMGGSWDEMDEQMAREGAAIKKSFHSAVKRTRRTKKRVPGGPNNRQARKGLVQTS